MVLPLQKPWEKRLISTLGLHSGLQALLIIYLFSKKGFEYVLPIYIYENTLTNYVCHYAKIVLSNTHSWVKPEVGKLVFSPHTPVDPLVWLQPILMPLASLLLPSTLQTLTISRKLSWMLSFSRCQSCSPCPECSPFLCPSGRIFLIQKEYAHVYLQC